MSAENKCTHSPLLRPADLAEWLGKTTAVLANMRYRGEGPKFIKMGGSIRYRVSDVEAWLDDNTFQQSGE